MTKGTERASGLKEVEVVPERGELTEWERDRLLIELTIRVSRLRRGAFKTYGRYLIPFAIALPLSGLLTYTSYSLSQKKLPIGFLYLADLFMVVGFFLVILTLVLLFYDFIRFRYLDSITGDTLAEFKCEHFEKVTNSSGNHPSCNYFNRTLDDSPICLICPIYRVNKSES